MANRRRAVIAMIGGLVIAVSAHAQSTDTVAAPPTDEFIWSGLTFGATLWVGTKTGSW